MLDIVLSRQISDEKYPTFETKKSWYDIYCQISDYKNPTKKIAYTKQRFFVYFSCSSATIQNCFAENDVDSSKVTHAMRPGGVNAADEAGCSGEQKRIGGRWSRDKMESAYLSQLPKAVMRSIAEFSKEKGGFYVPRSEIQPPDNLLNEVFPWIEDEMTNHQNGECDVADKYFLRLLKHLRSVFIQDAAFLIERFPSNPLFGHKLFRTDSFGVFSEKVRKHQQIHGQKDAGMERLHSFYPELVDSLSNSFASLRDGVLHMESTLDAKTRVDSECDQIIRRHTQK